MSDLLRGKWLDPAMAALAAYDCILRGLQRKELNVAIKNMNTFFPDFPDTHAITALHENRTAYFEAGLPLFLDGLAKIKQTLPLPAGSWIFAECGLYGAAQSNLQGREIHGDRIAVRLL